MQYSLLQVVLIMLDGGRDITDFLYIDEVHPAARAMLETGALSICRTNKPFFRCPVDLTLKQIVNANAAV